MGITLLNELPPVGLTGLGHALPALTRNNHDAIFASLQREGQFANLFTGYGERRVLGPDESLTQLMGRAARAALTAAQVPAERIRLLTGFASVSEFLAPSELFHLHRELELVEDAEVLPIADEFTPFLSGLRVAAERLLHAPSEVALVVSGCHWTANVDYCDPVSASIGDGAGAGVVQRLDQHATRGDAWRLLGWNYTVPRNMYGVMRMTARSGGHPSTLQDVTNSSRPLFAMLPESVGVFQEWGTTKPVELAHELLKRAGINPADVTCIAHQASRYLLDAWREALKPVQFVDTLESLGNMTLATIPVTLSLHSQQIRTPFVLLLGLGLGIHAAACLVARWPASQ